MVLIESTNLANMCDYTFGDQSSVINNVYGGFMKEANSSNTEFMDKYESLKNANKYYMTLFIDNIRLYNRDIKFLKESDRPYVDGLLRKNDLLQLCSELSDMNFIIFTGFEDTPIDDYIFDKIPKNVLGIFAANAISFGGKVHPIPYGLKRKMTQNEPNKNDILLSLINDDIQPTKLLYINHTISNNYSERNNLHDLFQNKPWATVTLGGLNYENYLKELKQHKFMLSPNGNAVDCDCHRNWELFYLKRVPIVKRCKYLEFLFKGYPVLFVDDFSEVTEELLIENEHLYEEALNIDYEKLDLQILFNSYINKVVNIKNYLENNEEYLKPWLVNDKQGRIDLKILPYLQDIENGVFVEAGAVDGLFMSNTKLLEDLGWTGVLIEPSKKAYEKCIENRNCFMENCALKSFDNKDEFVLGDFNYDGHQGLGARSKIGGGYVKVQAKTLTEILLNLDIKNVDLFSLDVEGYEIEVLNGIDFNLINFKYLLVEVNSDNYSLNEMDELLLSKGFENIRKISNFRFDNMVNWPGNHQDYLYKNTKI